MFSTGNYGKVLPVTRVEDRHLQPGPVYTRARELYWEFAHGGERRSPAPRRAPRDGEAGERRSPLRNPEVGEHVRPRRRPAQPLLRQFP